MKIVFIFIIMFLVIVYPVQANESVFSGYTEVGKRSTAEDYEEEDTDYDYTYQNYHLKFKAKVSEQLSYDISTFFYDKKYETADSLDSTSRLYKTNWSYYLKKLKEEYLRFDFKFNIKQKRYDNKPSGEYDQTSPHAEITFKKEDLYKINFGFGVDNFDYLEADTKDELKFVSRLGIDRYLLDSRLLLTSSYKIEALEHKKIERGRTKQDYLAGFDYLFSWPWIYEIMARASWGQRDTKEDDERDEDYDYEYGRYYIQTEHRMNKKLKAKVKYQYLKKDYLAADLDNRGFYVHNGWDYEILDDKEKRIWLGFDVQHKAADYPLKSDNDYKKETAGITTGYQRKKDWKIQVSLENNFYDYSESNNDKNRYYTKLSLEKLLKDGDMVLSADFKYKYTDYEYRDDTRQQSVRLGFAYKF